MSIATKRPGIAKALAIMSGSSKSFGYWVRDFLADIILAWERHLEGFTDDEIIEAAYRVTEIPNASEWTIGLLKEEALEVRRINRSLQGSKPFEELGAPEGERISESQRRALHERLGAICRRREA